MEAFSWRQHAMLVYTENKDANNDRPCYFAAEGLYLRLGQHNLTVKEHVIELEHLNIRASVREIREHGRVVFVCCSWDILRSLLVQFLKDGVELEDFVFFFIDLFAEGLEGPGPVRPWFRGDQDDQAAKLAFRPTPRRCSTSPSTTLCTISSLQVSMMEQDVRSGSERDTERAETRTRPGRVQRPRGDLVTRRMWNRTFSGSGLGTRAGRDEGLGTHEQDVTRVRDTRAGRDEG
ncbi:Atrial natriuretic peptide receptor 1 [Dissostichus eleginoides]|uniref:Atrial natriuretic peptide receptor 1 n=1 Tax=Dissostichus eleginoides TaxID=100907 RepID=A0AAD9B5U5_DISEL|nr:Atrial natriuretic peptide receptor 1 [Dissostichus eleginoides]